MIVLWSFLAVLCGFGVILGLAMLADRLDEEFERKRRDLHEKHFTGEGV